MGLRKSRPCGCAARSCVRARANLDRFLVYLVVLAAARPSGNVDLCWLSHAQSGYDHLELGERLFHTAIQEFRAERNGAAVRTALRCAGPAVNRSKPGPRSECGLPVRPMGLS